MITIKPNSISARWYNYFPQTGKKKQNTSSGSSGEYHFLPKIQPHPTSYMLQCWDTSSKTTNKAGTQPHPSAHRLSEYSSAHQKDQTQLYLPVGRNKILPPGSLCKPLRLRQPYPRGQTAEAKRTTILQPTEKKSQSQKIRQNEVAEEYVPDDGTR